MLVKKQDERNILEFVNIDELIPQTIFSGK